MIIRLSSLRRSAMFIDRTPVHLSAIRRGGAKVRIHCDHSIRPSEWRRRWDIVVAINI